MLVAISLFLVIIVYGLLEYRLHRRNVEKIPIRILVNGTRGKTSVSRIIAYSMIENGNRVMCRTTGSSSEMIFPDGRVEKIIRKRPARILELVSFFKIAAKEDVDVVVLECMALQAENQKTLADTLVRPTSVVITNTYIDHVPEMGKTIEETAWCLSLSVPKGVDLFVVDDYYDNLPVNIHKVKVDETLNIDGSIPIHPASWAISKSLLSEFGIGEEVMLMAKDKIPPDIGLLKEIKGKKGSIFIPTFSVNDKECMKSTILDEMKRYPDLPMTIIFNNREDREHRIVFLIDILKAIKNKNIEIAVIGDWRKKVSYYFRFYGISSYISTPCEIAVKFQDTKDRLFIGLGNIKGKGEELISLLREENV